MTKNIEMPWLPLKDQWRCQSAGHSWHHWPWACGEIRLLRCLWQQMTTIWLVLIVLFASSSHLSTFWRSPYDLIYDKTKLSVLSTSETVIHHEMRNDRAFLFRNFQSQTSRNSRGRFRLNGTASKMLLDAFSICQFWQDDNQSVSWYHNYIYTQNISKYYI